MREVDDDANGFQDISEEQDRMFDQLMAKPHNSFNPNGPKRSQTIMISKKPSSGIGSGIGGGNKIGGGIGSGIGGGLKQPTNTNSNYAASNGINGHGITGARINNRFSAQIESQP